MKTTHPFVAPVLGSTQSKVNMEAYEQAIDQYNEGNYLGAFYQLLDHLNPEFRTKYGNANGTEFHIPHGSILVHIRIADDRLHISADFLILPEKGRVAMLRQVADLNINRLMLPRFRKEDDRLMMEYACPLSQSHPHKLYFILRNICHVGDRYDDEFCTKFGAQRSYEPQVTPYPEEEVTRIYEAVRQTCRETLDAVKEYETERKYGYSWNVIDIALYKIAYFAHPQGQLLNDLDKAVDDMDKELPVAELVAKGKAFCSQCRARRWRATFTWSTRWFRPSAAPRSTTCRRTSRRCTRRLPKPSNRRISSVAPSASSTSSTKCITTTTCRTT